MHTTAMYLPDTLNDVEQKSFIDLVHSTLNYPGDVSMDTWPCVAHADMRGWVLCLCYLNSEWLQVAHPHYGDELTDLRKTSPDGHQREALMGLTTACAARRVHVHTQQGGVIAAKILSDSVFVDEIKAAKTREDCMLVVWKCNAAVGFRGSDGRARRHSSRLL